MDDNLLQEFLNESREHLITIEADLLAIEEGGNNLDDALINKVFRAAHSIKGGSGFLGLTQVKELSHRAETVLHLLRTRKLAPNIEVINILLAAFDRLREMINCPGESERTNIEDLVASLTSLATPRDESKTAGAMGSAANAKPDPALSDQIDLDRERARQAGQCIYSVEYDLIHDIEGQGLNLLQIFRELRESGEILDSSMDFESVGTLEGPIAHHLPFRLVFATTLALEIVPQLLMVPPEKVKLIFDPHTAPDLDGPADSPEPASASPEEAAAAPANVLAEVAPVPAPPAARPIPVTPAEPVAESAPAPSVASRGATAEAPDETLRVHVGLLENLMNLAGELVLSRNQLHAAIAQKDEQSLTMADQRLNQVTSELQDTIMRTRLQPIGSVFGKLPRIVRDLAHLLKKEVELDIRGKEVALDRSLIEGLSDPLTHMVRNAVDHGLEMPAERIKAGKKGPGTIRVEARHEAGQVIVEIADDGRGSTRLKLLRRR
ncbi:MAG: Hpt domain-containing protein [Verrucomicrobiota bacterium]